MNIPEVDLCIRPNDLRAIRPQDYDITGCGETVIPPNTRYIDLVKVYPYVTTLAAIGDAAGGDILPDEKKQVDCNCDFFLHKIWPLNVDGTLATGYYGRIQWANGRYTSQQLQDIQTLNGVCYAQDPARNTVAMRYPAGSNIGISLQNFQEVAVQVLLLFEGVSRFYLCRKGGR